MTDGACTRQDQLILHTSISKPVVLSWDGPWVDSQFGHCFVFQPHRIWIKILNNGGPSIELLFLGGTQLQAESLPMNSPQETQSNKLSRPTSAPLLTDFLSVMKWRILPANWKKCYIFFIHLYSTVLFSVRSHEFCSLVNRSTCWSSGAY